MEDDGSNSWRSRKTPLIRLFFVSETRSAQKQPGFISLSDFPKLPIYEFAQDADALIAILRYNGISGKLTKSMLVEASDTFPAQLEELIDFYHFVEVRIRVYDYLLFN